MGLQAPFLSDWPPFSSENAADNCIVVKIKHSCRMTIRYPNLSYYLKCMLLIATTYNL
jgi:hypothetical protein